MIKTIVSIEMPVDERLLIRKNSFSGGTSDKRVCIVTGTHGDELEGQYVCFLLARELHRHPDLLDGTVDIYPALNPLGIDSITRGIPGFDLDMNRIFPGDPHGGMYESTAYSIIQDLVGSTVVIDIHSSNIFLREVPQVRINQLTAEKLVPMARLLDIDFIWVHEAATVLESTLAYSLNVQDTPVLVVEMGVGMRITNSYGERLVAGIFNMLRSLGMWKDGKEPTEYNPIDSTKGHVEFVNADSSGIFLTSKEKPLRASAGEVIGQVVDSLTGETLQEIQLEKPGYVFTIRAYPVVYEGSLLARIFREDAE
ncbi:MAG: M14 family metallopeptidase [Desulfovibrionaceae bacterium]|nr:M14 family metallopeptidase [Desulfovibrionaceae bacterium]